MIKKNINKIIATVLLVVMLSGCSDTNQETKGENPTENQYNATTNIVELFENVEAPATPNAEAVLWREIELDNYSGTIQRLGHTEEGTPYLVFVQQYFNADGGAYYWKPIANDTLEHWLMLDFGKPMDINEIYIHCRVPSADGRPSNIEDWRLEYNKGTPEQPEWVTIKEEKGNTRYTANAVFDTVTTQQVRFYITKCHENWSGDVPNITNFNVYGDSCEKNLAEDATVTASSSDGSYLPKLAIKRLEDQQISCITAVDLEGNILWQKGTPKSVNYTVGSDLPIEIYDIDNDGVEEIITVYNDHIQILSPDGNVEREVPCSYVTADSIIICDLRGRGRAEDIIVKNRHSEVVAYTGELEFMWNYRKEVTGVEDTIGHYPWPYDLDNDGKDELVIGNCSLDDDGSIYDTYLYDSTVTSEHVDAVRIGDFDPKREGVEIVTAHSENGTNFITQDGELYTHDLRTGHAQKLAIGEFVPTISGSEVFTFSKAYIKAFMSLHLHKANGERIWPEGYYYKGVSGDVIQIEPSSFILAGSGQEYLLQNRVANMIDAYQNTVVQLPNGSVNRFGWSVDISGDGRDELLMWNNKRVQIWTNVAKIPDGGKNLCANATVETDSEVDGYQADCLIDGEREKTMWMSADVPGEHYIIVDFGESKTFDELWLYHYDNKDDTYYLDNFMIQYNAGTAEAPQWENIYEVKANMKKQAAFTFEPITAQQVRILIMDPTTALIDMDSVARVCEIEIYEALGSYIPVEGEMETEKDEVIIDFGKKMTVDGASLVFEGSVKDYTLEYNGGTATEPVWMELATTLCNNANTNNYAFSPVVTDALRVVVTDGDGAIKNIFAREWEGYDFKEVENELIINPTKSGVGGSYRWTQY